MKTNGNDKALESYSIFPIVAWIIIISFFLFVYNLATDLQNTADRLETQSMELQERVNATSTAYINFEI